MKVTDYTDKVQLDYDPLIDTDVDIDAPYIQFDFEEEIESATLPESGVYDTLFYNDEKIMIVNEVSEVEIRFYSTENPNENYRTGQKHFKGRILDIKQVTESGNDFGGYSISVDMSKQFNAKTQKITIDKTYTDITKTRCIAILYFNETGRVIRELVIPIDDWFSSKVYINTAYVIEEDEKLAYKVGDIVDIEYYKKVYEDEENNKYSIKLASDTGRISDMKLTKKKIIYTQNNNTYTEYVYYYLITFDCSDEFNKRIIIIAHNVITSMKVHVIIPEV